MSQSKDAKTKRILIHQIVVTIDLQPGKRTIGSKWVYEVKTDGGRWIERYKAGLVAQGL